ncbi:MAG TPA: serine hydroxymethyltransferase [Candidatus Azoamicus sp. MARI]
MSFNYIKNLISLEKKRQNNVINLIASENLVSENILFLQSSVFSNKYAEGYPYKRYYGGCKNVDKIEILSINLCKKLFKVKYANVQPHSGSQANQSVYMALCKPGDVILGLDLMHGGHLSHGFKNNFSGHYYKAFSYQLNKVSYHIDYDDLHSLAKKCKPRIIVAGTSAYSRIINWRTIKDICKSVNAYFLADISHVAGMIVTNLYPSPCEFADVITSTVQKTLRGTRGGIILTNCNYIIKKINKSVFPGIQGGPAINIIASKALSFFEASKTNFIVYQKNVLKNSKLLSNIFKKYGFSIVSGGSDTHLFLVDLTTFKLTGLLAEMLLERFNIIVNKNSIPFDKFNSEICSGIRIGSSYITSRGFSANEINFIAKSIAKILTNKVKTGYLKYSLLKLCKKNKIFIYEKSL